MEPTIFKPRLKFKPPLKFFKFGHWTNNTSKKAVFINLCREINGNNPQELWRDHYLGGIIGEEIIGPNKVENGVKFKSKGYSEFLKDHFMPLYRNPNSKVKKLELQQDNAPWHASRENLTNSINNRSLEVIRRSRGYVGMWFHIEHFLYFILVEI